MIENKRWLNTQEDIISFWNEIFHLISRLKSLENIIWCCGNIHTLFLKFPIKFQKNAVFFMTEIFISSWKQGIFPFFENSAKMLNFHPGLLINILNTFLLYKSPRRLFESFSKCYHNKIIYINRRNF